MRNSIHSSIFCCVFSLVFKATASVLVQEGTLEVPSCEMLGETEAAKADFARCQALKPDHLWAHEMADALAPRVAKSDVSYGAGDAYGNYGAVGELRRLPVTKAFGDASKEVPVATGAGMVTVRPPRAKPGTVRAADYGFSVENDDNAASLQRAVDAAKAQNAGRLVLAPGIYRCYGTKGVVLDGLEDFELDGAGAELVFRREPTDPIVPSWHHDSSRANFVIRNCRRVRVGGFDMDWDWKTAPLATCAVVTRVHVDASRDLASFVEFELLGHGDRHPYYGQTFPLQYMIPMTSDFRARDVVDGNIRRGDGGEMRMD